MEQQDDNRDKPSTDRRVILTHSDGSISVFPECMITNTGIMDKMLAAAEKMRAERASIYGAVGMIRDNRETTDR